MDTFIRNNPKKKGGSLNKRNHEHTFVALSPIHDEKMGQPHMRPIGRTADTLCPLGLLV